MKQPVTPWVKDIHQTWCYHREFLNKESLRGQLGAPWLYAKVWKKRTGSRWYYDAWYFAKTWETRLAIEGYTFSKAKSQRIVDAWLAKRRNLRLLSKESYQKLQVFM